MRIVFSVLHFGFVKYYESVLAQLAQRGHEIHVIADEPERLGGQQLVERLASAHPGLSWGWAPQHDTKGWYSLALKIRYAMDLVRFHSRRYRDFPKLRIRAEDRAPRLVLWLLKVPLVNTVAGRQILMRWMVNLERALPRNKEMDSFLSEQHPEVLLLGSLLATRSQQVDHLRSAKALRIPTGVCVSSWDRLSSKSLIRETPERLFLWNEMQLEEATSMHGVSKDRVVITGAQCYDQWFERSPSRSREEFCARFGLDPSMPVLLYVCSALTPSPHEPAFVREWIETLRSSGDALLRECSILVRPHPEKLNEWKDVSLEDFAKVSFYGSNPIDESAKADYFDSLYHADAVVGVVTTSFLEAAIVGTPVLTFLEPRFRVHQQGMLHFRYLIEVEDGLLSCARSTSEHLQQLGDAIRDDTDRPRRDRFLRAFVRPAGLGRHATPLFVKAVEAMAGIKVRETPLTREQARLSHMVPRLVLWSDKPLGRWLLMERRSAIKETERNRRLRKDRRTKRWSRRRRIIARYGRTIVASIRGEQREYFTAKHSARRARLAVKRTVRRDKRRNKWGRLWEKRKRLARAWMSRLWERLSDLIIGPSG